MNHLYILFAAAGAAILLFVFKKARFRDLLGSAAVGAVSFFAANLLGEALGVHIPLNGFTAAVFLLSGAPGVICLHLLSAILR